MNDDVYDDITREGLVCAYIICNTHKEPDMHECTCVCMYRCLYVGVFVYMIVHVYVCVYVGSVYTSSAKNVREIFRSIYRENERHGFFWNVRMIMKGSSKGV